MRLKCIVFGASKTGSVAYRLLKKQYEIIGFSDNNPQKWGQLFCGKEILNPKELVSYENVEIIIASVYYASIYQQLKELGIHNIQVFYYMGSAADGVSDKYRLYQLSDMLFQSCIYDRNIVEKIEEDFSYNYPLVKKEENNLLKKTDRKKVLFCAYIFPPIGGAGVQRSLKFVKYLRDYGYEPIVLTVGENDGKLPLDETLLQEIPRDISVIRVDVKTFIPEMLSQEDQQSVFNLYCGVTKSERWMNDYRDLILNIDNRLIPDNQMLWVNECLKQIEGKVHLSDIDIIYTTGNPYSTYFLGYYIKKKYGTKWVQDYRDPWMTNQYYLDNYYDNKKQSELLQKQLENELIQYSDAVIIVAPGAAQEYVTQFNIPEEKIHLITNGYDEADFEIVTVEGKKNGKFTLCYNGMIYLDRNPLKLLNIINELIFEGDIMQDQIVWIFNGNIDTSWKEKIDLADRYHIVRYNGQLTHLNSIKSAMESDLLVLFGAKGSKVVYPGKVFEYIRMQKPILSFSAEGGGIENILRETQTGENFEYNDIEGTKKFLMKKYKQWKNKEKVNCGNKAAIEKYSRRYLTHKLVDIFDRLLE